MILGEAQEGGCAMELPNRFSIARAISELVAMATNYIGTKTRPGVHVG